MFSSPSFRFFLVALVLAPAATSAATSGPVPGCAPARHVAPILGPWDHGSWFFPKWTDRNIKPLRLAIVFVWYNLGADSIKNNHRNPGQPPWSNQVVKKVKITPWILKNLGGKKVRMFGMGGEAYIYKNTRACRKNIRFEFRHGNVPKVSLARLADLGLAYIY